MKEFTKDQLEYILQWLNSWEQLKGSAIPLRFKEVFLTPKEKCKDYGCIYSKSMDQPYPRLCIVCNHMEEVAIDQEKIRLSKTQISTSGELALALRFLNQRDILIQRFRDYPGAGFPFEELEYCNKQIKSFLNL